jgi:hypothetical protein
MVTFQLYWRKKTLGAPLYIISGTIVNLSRTTNILEATWVAFSNKDIEEAGVA